MYGVSYINNSFGQPTGYVYAGRQCPDVFEVRKLYLQWTAGVLYGYKGEYQHRVPLNYGGFAPAVIGSIGWHVDPQLSAQLDKAGVTGPVMVQCPMSGVERTLTAAPAARAVPATAAAGCRHAPRPICYAAAPFPACRHPICGRAWTLRFSSF